jgi:hypothetical protein
MAGPILTDGTSRAGMVTLVPALTRAGTVARVLEINVPVTHASAATHVTAAVHVPVVIPALAATHARRAGSSRAGVLAPTRG